VDALVSALDESKRQMRRTLRSARAGISAEARHAAEQSIVDRLDSLLVGSGSVGLYAAGGSEVSLDALALRLERRGVSLAWPKVDGHTLRLQTSTLGCLVPGYRGLREPPAGSAACALSALDALIVPGLGFDATGRRLGQGGGFYDRLLAHAEGHHTIGVCFALQVVDVVPTGETDVALLRVVTEAGHAMNGQWLPD
jgi:5-formyltetrahydrofolate cyclo-ligase